MSRKDNITRAARAKWQKLAKDVMVEKRKFKNADWLSHFRKLRKDIVAYGHLLDQIGIEHVADQPDPRELLIWAWCVMLAKPAEAAQFYEQIPEKGSGSLEEMATQLRDSGYAFDKLDTAPKLQMSWLGALVRSIDADLAGLLSPAGSLSGKAEDWIVEGYPCYVVPVRRTYRAENGKGRERRATLYHAIIPRQVGDLSVDLAMVPDVEASEKVRQWTYGAPIFEDATVDIDPVGEKGFRILDAPVPNEFEVVEDHVREALEGKCDALVWPELTVPETRLDIVVSALRKNPLGDPRRIGVTVAGTRHALTGGKWVNRAEVFYGKGQALGHYDKRRTFEVGGRYEEIEPGEKLLVLVTEDRLIGIAICKDFCDDVDNDIYAALSLDLLLVPSMGRRSTIDAHLRHAKALQTQQGTVSFIVQQVDVPTGEMRDSGEPPAYSFASPGASNAPTRAKAKQSDRFRLHSARR